MDPSSTAADASTGEWNRLELGSTPSTRLKYPVWCLITRGAMEDEESDISSNVTCQGSDGELSDWEEEGFNDEDAGIIDKCVILHPSKSAYATRYPSFNPFAGEPLINNGYVNSMVDYLNATFIAYNNMEE